jgi:WD40 repeat protein
MGAGRHHIVPGSREFATFPYSCDRRTIRRDAGFKHERLRGERSRDVAGRETCSGCGQRQGQHKRIELRSLTSSEARVLLEDARQPSYAGGFLFFIRNQKIFAQPFDAGSGTVSGTATPLADADWYSLSGPSVLAFQSVSHDTRLQWFDMSGNPAGTTGQVANYLAPKIAPDGKQMLFMTEDLQNLDATDLWSLPAAGGVSRRMTFGPFWKGWSVWSPDGKYIAYGVKAPGKVSIVRKPSDGSGAEETLLTQGPEISASSVVDWSPDGRYLSFDALDINQGRRANWILPLFGDRKPFRCAPVVGGNQYDGNFSPDGHWLAYFSDETGQPEVYVVPFPGPGGKYQISHGGGWIVRWDKKGDLFFLSIGNQLMKAELNLSAQSLQVKSLRPLYQLNLADTPAPLFDVSADGQRLVAVTPARAESSAISLLLNWRHCCISRFCGRASHSLKQVTDAYLLGLAIHKRGNWQRRTEPSGPSRPDAVTRQEPGARLRGPGLAAHQE